MYFGLTETECQVDAATKPTLSRELFSIQTNAQVAHKNDSNPERIMRNRLQMKFEFHIIVGSDSTTYESGHSSDTQRQMNQIKSNE